MQNLAILYGGKSGEHSVSRVSALSVLRHLDTKRFNPILIGLSKEGIFYLQDEAVLSDAQKPETQTLGLKADPEKRVFVAPSEGFYFQGKKLPIDIVFPVLHGSFGEDGRIQGLLESSGLAYVGSPVLGSALGMDKEKAKAVWKAAGLPIVPYLVIRRHELADPALLEARLKAVESAWPYPVFVKPVSTGSSVGASKAVSREALMGGLKAALEWDDKALVEPFIHAREIECSVTGNERPQAYIPGEILPHHEFYDYDAKYLDPNGAELLIPAKLSQEETELVKHLAVEAYAALDCAGMARVDFFLDKESGRILLNEVNTIPGFTSISMFPKMCQAAGLGYAELLSHLIELGLERFKARASIRYD